MSKRILIVEDEESIADLEKDYLELSGFEVEVANDGQTGLDKALFGDFDLVILDLMLPGEEREVCFSLTKDDLSFWNGSSFAAEPGEFLIMAGSSSSHVLSQSITLAD